METFETSSEQMERNDCVSTNVEDPYSSLANSVRRELESLHPLSDQCCIYRVPKQLRQLDEKVYTPQVVSIGPFHHGREGLNAMEEHKRRYLKDFLQRTEVSLEDFVELVRENEARLRSCYADSIRLNIDDFVKMILVDAVFIIEVLMRQNFSELQIANDRIYAKPWMISDICYDMSLLENQLPFFILEEVLRLANIAIPLVKLAVNFFDYQGFCVTKDLLWNNSSPTVEHFVDLLRKCHLPSPSRRQREFKTLNIPSITELHQAGVKFKLASSKNLFDIQLNSGILEIPKLRMQDKTKLILKNLLAFERCHCLDNYISDYVVFVSYLVNAPKDVELLVQTEIMDNWMQKSEEVSTLFQNLGKNVVVYTPDFYFNGLIEDLNVYYRSPWHKWKAALKQDYFNTPWTTISVIAAVLLLILTVIQTVCSIISVTVPGRT